MKSLNNPFVEFGYKGPEYFCDREQETRQLITDLHNESNVALISPRRLGKTGLIMHVFHKMKTLEPNAVCIYIDLLNTTDINSFTTLLAQRIIGSLDSSIQSALRKATQLFQGLRPTLSFDELTGEPSLSVTIAPQTEPETIDQIFRYIDQSGRRCYIALDEFQQITQYPQKGLEALLRSHIQFLKNAYFIFSGSQQHLMTEMFLSPKRPFYLASQIMSLGEIDEGAYLEFANRFFSKQHRHMQAEDFHHLYTLVDGQTWYVQEILHQLYEDETTALDVQDINLAVDTLLSKWSVSFSTQYSLLTRNQARLLKAVAMKGTVKEPLAREFLLQYRLPAQSSVKMALNALISKQMIYKASGGYQVYDRFFALWLRRL